jgi:glycosyltransferase involved in cell wall biosynthesis
MKTVIAIPARNSEKTLERVFDDIPHNFKKNVILSDDGSTDNTANVAKRLKIKVFKNNRKHGYGSNVKNCFKKALEENADIVVILHSDNQYDATKIPLLVKHIEDGEADFVIGSRILGDNAKGMSAFRFMGNRILGFMENSVMGTELTDLHSGMIAVKADLLKKMPLNVNSDDYGFHTDIVLQSHYAGARFKEIGVPTRYEDISSSISIYKSVIYGFSTLNTLLKYILHKKGIIKCAKFILKANKKVQ